MRKPKVGEYYYRAYRGRVEVLRVDEVKGDFTMCSLISVHKTREAARDEVYRLNGWKNN
ncbi:MAG: hypothetical protein LBC68_10925 [Prevotellaceae bacterium]|jgi:hypothetical protein|nr:hypothetical protein [Prevotellaceae bacterium]